ncbi:hypothetical protein N9L68_07820 [bacterium]|nr:hypothetical protein [bacterium]
MTAQFERIIVRVSRTPMASIAEWPPRRRGALVVGVERGSRRGGLGQREAPLACATAASTNSRTRRSLSEAHRRPRPHRGGACGDAQSMPTTKTKNAGSMRDPTMYRR